MKCSACSALIPENARYCLACGQPVSSVSQMPTGLAPPAAADAAHRRLPARHHVLSPDPVGRLASSDSIDAGGFMPGAVLAERYRIIGLIGRGGMGEVYRADDLKLGQPVALKFLPAKRASERSWIERLYAEVRLARQISHPNVCRVYDVGEFEGRHFLSMEYVDGEDLASLLRRIGRLGGERAIQIAREIVAGLAAAHDKGVLHRDLKPGNVLIDGRGRARLTDFGLAVRAEEERGGGEIPGTPAYMAPEQLEGKGASVQSDLYALGLVLYELFTGRRAFEAATTAPSTVAPELDPAVERVILRCLEKDPKARPRSALAVAAALPGGDPLAAAIAAGETPSPEMVAAAGETGSMNPAAAWGFLAAILAGVALAAYLSPRAYLHGSVPLEKPPEALVERSKEIARRLGYTDKPLGTAWGFSRNNDYLRWVEEHDQSRDRWKDMADGRPAGIYFWYRQSPAHLVSERFRGGDSGDGTVTETDPAPATTGMIGVQLDPLGRLIRFEAVPSSVAPARSATPDWSILFAEAGLDAAAFSQAEPQWLPPFYADTRMAWVERKPERTDRLLRVEAAAWRSRPVFFDLAGPWSRPLRTAPAEPTRRRKAFGLLNVGVSLLLLAGGALIARRNLRLGRGDRRGAMRLASFIFVSVMLSWALAASHVASVSEFGLFVRGLTRALSTAGLGWMLYVALEPLIRRRWPDSLIAWTRLLSGRLTDPLVGRAVLAGAALGTFIAVSAEASQLVRRALEAIPLVPAVAFPNTLRGPRGVAMELLTGPAAYMLRAIMFAFLFFLFRAALKKEWLAAAAFVLLFATPELLTGGWIAWSLEAVVGIAVILVFLRFGLLALVFAGFFQRFLRFALTTDAAAWYAGTSLLVLVVLAALAVYGFAIAVRGQPLFAGARLDD